MTKKSINDYNLIGSNIITESNQEEETASNQSVGSELESDSKISKIEKIGGCKGTLAGCCADGKTQAKSKNDSCKNEPVSEETTTSEELMSSSSEDKSSDTKSSGSSVIWIIFTIILILGIIYLIVRYNSKFYLLNNLLYISR